MSVERPDTPALQDRTGQLEQAFIDEFVRMQGYEPAMLGELSEPQRHALLTRASTYAATKLAEVESRAHFVHEIHGSAREPGDHGKQ